MATRPPSIGRVGVYFHQPSKQYVSRLGFELNRNGKRVRAFQYLGPDPEEATLKHLGIVAEWKWFKTYWNAHVIGELTFKELVRTGLPPEVAETAEIDLPVWVQPEWVARAQERLKSDGETLKAAIIQAAIDKVRQKVDDIDGGREFIARFMAPPKPGEPDLAAWLPVDVRTRAQVAITPPAHEIAGFAAGAERLTLAQGKQRYLEDLKSRVGLPEEGIKPGTYQNVERMLRLALDLRVTDTAGIERYALDPNAMLHEIARDDLVAFKRAWLAKVTNGEVSKRTAANYTKQVQYLFSWLYERDRIITRRVTDIEDVFRFTDINPVRIADYAVAKHDLKAILAAAPERVKLYVYLALNCGMYQVDIGHLKLAEIQKVGKDRCITRRREKTSHQNDFESCHVLWPETWKLLEKHLAPADTTSNPHGLALLNEDGKPLYVGSAERSKIDNVTSAYWRVVHDLNEARKAKKGQPISLPFKQFRKLGATAMNDLGGQEVQKLYRSAAFDGADRFYVRGDFSKLTAALKRWRTTLQRDGIL